MEKTRSSYSSEHPWSLDRKNNVKTEGVSLQIRFNSIGK